MAAINGDVTIHDFFLMVSHTLLNSFVMFRDFIFNTKKNIFQEMLDGFTFSEKE